MTISSVNQTPAPGSRPADDIVSLFKDGRLMVRAVDARKGKWLGWETKPVTRLSPQCNNPLTKHGEEQVFSGESWVVTMLGPIERNEVELAWAYKHDAFTDAQGDFQPNKTHSKPIKKITDYVTLNIKMEEKYWQSKTIFPDTKTSGRIDSTGYLLHQLSSRQNIEKTYPEIICRINLGLMHCGYLLDFNREAAFDRVADMMQNILLLELGDDASAAGEFRQPLRLSVYDSERGVLFPPLKLQRHEIEAISANARTFSKYAQTMGQAITLFKVLVQSGVDRFLQLLINIPESIKPVAEAEKNLDLIKILSTGDILCSLPELLEAIENARLLNVNLPVQLLEKLISTSFFPASDLRDFKDRGNCIFLDMDLYGDRWQETKSKLGKQAQTCRKALLNRLFVPILLQGHCDHYSNRNPLVVCLLIVHGTRVDFQKKHLSNVTGSLWLLLAARYFCQESLLTRDEFRIIRHEILWQISCNKMVYTERFYTEVKPGQMAPPEGIPNTLATFIDNLKKVLARQSVSTGADWVENLCRELIGEKIYHQFYLNKNADGQKLLDYLQNGLSPQRFNDEQLIEHFRYMTTIPLSNNPLFSCLKIFHQEPKVNNFCVIRLPDKETGQSEWLDKFLTAPPNFVQSELDRIDHYPAITRVAGWHYYQNLHPTVAKVILEGGKPRSRKVHGLDHALRTQLATEFLVEVLPDIHAPFKELLKNQPLLQELLPIAELYHDAVAEDEHKDVEERRAAELFQRDMQSLHHYPDELIGLVSSALKNKNSNQMQPVRAPFTSDQQCSADELLLRQVLRFGDIVDIVRVIPCREDFPAIRLTPGFAEPGENRYFNPEAIELLRVVNKPEFTRLIRAALVSFRHLACITGGWHHKDANPFTTKYRLPVDNTKRRLMIEQASDPQQCMRDSLDDLVRLVMAAKAGIKPCLTDHPKRSDNLPLPDCWDPKTGSAGAYRKLHNEQELRQIELPENMTLTEKIIVAADELNHTMSLLSPATRHGMQSEIERLQQKGILPAIGTPPQSELEKIFRQPDCAGARILNERGLKVVSDEYDGRVVYRMKPNDQQQQKKAAR
ncbi:hypothetical protein [Endozoicomonas sp. ALE010]|uniref:hypothetical protein n=1 Tax=Endozoicomonas sp. ALE010 TaxID=3403081 RepID=UPI003BB5C1C4